MVLPVALGVGGLLGGAALRGIAADQRGDAFDSVLSRRDQQVQGINRQEQAAGDFLSQGIRGLQPQFQGFLQEAVGRQLQPRQDARQAGTDQFRQILADSLAGFNFGPIEFQGNNRVQMEAQRQGEADVQPRLDLLSVLMGERSLQPFDLQTGQNFQVGTQDLMRQMQELQEDFQIGRALREQDALRTQGQFQLGLQQAGQEGQMLNAIGGLLSELGGGALAF